MIRKMAVEGNVEFVPQAIIARSPTILSNRGITFKSDYDDLNEYKIAELCLETARLSEVIPFVLMQYVGTPTEETELYLPKTIPIENALAVSLEILRDLDLPADAISWVRESMENPF